MRESILMIAIDDRSTTTTATTAIATTAIATTARATATIATKAIATRMWLWNWNSPPLDHKSPSSTTRPTTTALFEMPF